MDIKDIFEIWDRFEQSKATEIEIECQGTHIHLKSGNATKTSIVQETEAVQTKQENIQTMPETISNKVQPIKAPLVGTFYQASSPDAEAFVKVGQSVKKGDVIGIIEAMKLMNEVTAPEDGVVKEILAEDGQMVEFNQVLVTLAK